MAAKAHQESRAQRRVRDDGDIELRAGLRDAVAENLREPHRVLDLDAAIDARVLRRLADRSRADLRQPNRADLALIDERLQRLHRHLQRRALVPPRGLEHVDALCALQDVQAIVDAAANTLGRAVRARRGEARVREAALDGEDDAGGVLGVLGEVSLDDMEGVVLGGAVELAAVPDVRAGLESGLHALNGVLGGVVAEPGEGCRAHG